MTQRSAGAHLSAGSVEGKITADVPRALSPTLGLQTSGETITAAGLRAETCGGRNAGGGGPAARGTSALRGRRRVFDL